MFPPPVLHFIFIHVTRRSVPPPDHSNSIITYPRMCRMHHRSSIKSLEDKVGGIDKGRYFSKAKLVIDRFKDIIPMGVKIDFDAEAVHQSYHLLSVHALLIAGCAMP